MRRAQLGFATALAAWASLSVPVESALGDSMKVRRNDSAVAPSSPVSQPKIEARTNEPLSARFSRADKAKAAPEWVLSKPARFTQKRKSPRERGINPCLTRDPGFGSYSKWDRSPSMGQMIVPRDLRVKSSGEFDVMFHFHGHEPARKEWVQAIDGPVLVAVDLGNGSGPYSAKFSVPSVFPELVRSIERAIAERSGNPDAHVGRVGLSAWSAGYGAVEQILRSSYGRALADSVILLDGLHTGYDEQTLRAPTLDPFVQFAREASESRRFMFVSHSSIIPPNYASTTETANFLIWKVGGRPELATPRASDPMGLELITRFSQGNFHVRGFAGNDTHDHCAHLGLYRDVLRTHIAPRWRATLL